ncbi:MAG: peptide deformylase [Legionella sp.]|nr:peptide deformylase [Legionella sp.]
MKQNNILQVGNPILRTKASPIAEELFGSSHLVDLAGTLINIMSIENGIGLAAPQIGISKRAIVFGFNDLHLKPHLPNIPCTILFNPSFEPTSDALVEDYEGCLSVGTLRAKVPRYQSIYFSGYDIEGKKIEKEVSGLHARVFQHEYDHLDGILFLDRVIDYHSLGFHDELKKAGVF